MGGSGVRGVGRAGRGREDPVVVASLSRRCRRAGEIPELRAELASTDIDTMKDAVKKVRVRASKAVSPGRRAAKPVREGGARARADVASRARAFRGVLVSASHLALPLAHSGFLRHRRCTSRSLRT